MKTILISLLIFAIHFNLSAQSNAEQYVKAKQRLRELTDELNYCLQRLTDCKLTNSIRFQYSSEALNLFIGYGKPIMVNGTKADEIKVEVTSGYRPISTRSLKAYFSYLINGFENYTIIELVDSKIYEIIPSEIYKISDNYIKFKAKYYKCSSDFNANRYETVTITQAICMCCDCVEPIIFFGNIKVRAMTKL